MNSQQPTSPLVLEQKLSKLKQQLADHKQTYQQAISLNQTLKPSLNLINSNLQTKVKPQHDKLLNQRKAVYKLLNYDNKISLKQNYLLFYHQSCSRKHQLAKNLQKMQKRNMELSQKSISLNQQILQTTEAKNTINQYQIHMEQLLSNLEQERLNKLSIKSTLQKQKYSPNEKPHLNHSQNQQLHRSEFDSSDEQQVLSQFDSYDEGYPNRSINSKASSNQQSVVKLARYNKSQSFHYHAGTFPDSHEIFDSFEANTKPKSKQILNSLQKQLNPLKLNEIISFLQNQIDHLKKHQLSKLLKLKHSQSRKKKSLLEKENHCINKLDRIRTHINNFKNQKFPNSSL